MYEYKKFTYPFFYHTSVLFPIRKWLVYVNFVRNHEKSSPGGCTILQSHQKCVRIPVAPHPCQHLLLLVFWILALLTVVKEHCFIVVAICISLMTNYVEYSHICFLIIGISSLVKCVFKSSVCFSLGCLFFHCRFLRSLHTFWIQSYVRYIYTKYIFPNLWHTSSFC